MSALATQRRPAHVRPSVNLLHWADRAWERAWERAELVDHGARHLADLERRRLQGRAWLAAHPAHARAPAANARLLELEHEIGQAAIALRCVEIECWMACVEAHGFRVNAGERTAEVIDLWREVLPDHDPPRLHYIGGCLVVPGRESLRSTLARWPDEQET